MNSSATTRRRRDSRQTGTEILRFALRMAKSDIDRETVAKWTVVTLDQTRMAGGQNQGVVRWMGYRKIQKG